MSRSLFSTSYDGPQGMRLLAVVLLMLGFCSFVTAQEPDEELPKLAEMELPSVEDLLTKPPRDWIILNSDEVVIAEPVAPRPDTLAKIAEMVEEKTAARRNASAEERETLQTELNELQYLYLILPDVRGAPEVRIPVRRVKEIWHHEDLMIRRADALIQEQDLVRSMELLNRLQLTRPDWPGLAEAHNQTLRLDAELKTGKGQHEAALVVLNELFRRDKEFPNLAELFGESIGSLVTSALDAGDYRRAHFFLNDLRKRFPDHPVYQSHAGELLRQAREHVSAGQAAFDAGEYRTATLHAEDAARIWPPTPELKAFHRVASERYQRLHVGVLESPMDPHVFPFSTNAEEREARLTTLTLFEVDRVRDGTAYYRTRFFDEWEPTDLGREMRFTLRQFRQPSEMQQVLTTSDVVRPLLRRLDPKHPEFDERLASYVDSLVIHSPSEFSLIFHRVPPRVEPLLADVSLGLLGESGGFGTQPGFGGGAEDTAEEDAPSLGVDPGGFALRDAGERIMSYERKLAEPNGLPQYHVAEVVEHQYDGFEPLLQGLLRGEVSVVPDFPDWIIRRMQSDEVFLRKFFILPYAAPTTHAIYFNPKSRPLRIRELRRALAYAIDREKVLRDVILRDEKALHGRVVNGPFLANSPARNVLVGRRPYDLSSGLAMALAASRQLKGKIPKLRMVVSPRKLDRAALDEILSGWKRIGIEVEILEADDPNPGAWDLAYRSHQMFEPAVELWPALTAATRARIADLAPFPDWLSQELIQLDRTSDQSRSIEALHSLHDHLWTDAAMIPLWEVDRFIVFRKNVRGFVERPMHEYDKVDRWVVDSWYESELP